LALGADEVSLGTALMIAEQCIFCHGCSKGNCPAGITTQSDLTARRLMTEKKGRPADDVLPDLEEERYQDAKLGVTRYLRSLAGDLRKILAQLGLTRPEDLLEQIPSGHARVDKIDLSELLTQVGATPQKRASLHIDPTNEINTRLLQ